MLTQSKDMAEKQNPSRTWYISLTLLALPNFRFYQTNFTNQMIFLMQRNNFVGLTKHCIIHIATKFYQTLFVPALIRTLGPFLVFKTVRNLLTTVCAWMYPSGFATGRIYQSYLCAKFLILPSLLVKN